MIVLNRSSRFTLEVCLIYKFLFNPLIDSITQAFSQTWNEVSSLNYNYLQIFSLYLSKCAINTTIELKVLFVMVISTQNFTIFWTCLRLEMDSFLLSTISVINIIDGFEKQKWFELWPLHEWSSSASWFLVIFSSLFAHFKAILFKSELAKQRCLH